MPAVTIATFTDADGDEFPVVVHGATGTEPEERLEAAGRDEVQRLVDDGTWRPTMPLTLAEIVRP